VKITNFPAILTGSGPKTEVAENKPLNPVEPFQNCTFRFGKSGQNFDLDDAQCAIGYPAPGRNAGPLWHTSGRGIGAKAKRHCFATS
jgi:hypothetical protein